MAAKSSFFSQTGPTYVGENPASSSNDGAITFVIDGGAAVIGPGVKVDLEIPFACTINSWTLLADQTGSIEIDIWKSALTAFPPTSDNSITGTEKPSLSAQASAQSSTLEGWNKSIATGDALRVNVDSATTITRVTVTLKITKG